MKRKRRVARVDGYEFRIVPGKDGGQPYLRMGNPYAANATEEYLGAVCGRSNIRKLRDFLTAFVRAENWPPRPSRRARGKAVKK